jgi:hypothetical protein
MIGMGAEASTIVRAVKADDWQMKVTIFCEITLSVA